MEIILVTGPDGAGKSTLISKLKKHQNLQTAFFIVPVVNQELTISDDKIAKVLYFINWLYLEAESLKVPGLRSLSLFAYMLVFRDLQSDLNAQGKKLMVCDRHPLVDSVIYGKLYAPHIDPDLIPAPVLAEVDYNFNAELLYLTKLLGLKKVEMPKGSCYHMSEFIFRFFKERQVLRQDDLKKLFKCDYPSKIVYLSIAPDVLERRLKNSRKHLTEIRGESNKLVGEFEQLMESIPVDLMKVNANELNELDRCAEELTTAYF